MQVKGSYAERGILWKNIKMSYIFSFVRGKSWTRFVAFICSLYKLYKTTYEKKEQKKIPGKRQYCL